MIYGDKKSTKVTFYTTTIVLQFINFFIAILIIYLIFIIDFFLFLLSDRHDSIIHTLHKCQFDIFIKYTFNTRHQILLFKKR